mmetsp:Transcript_16966/g.18946  ORF Transcript_16966/g.18946 Transcript_16966/m.18946 type:complete len:211 (+) Transcript_16966:335-967(+)
MMGVSISKANILFFTGPLYVPFFAYLFIGESISKVDAIALIFGFTGILIINNPFSEHETSSNEFWGGVVAAFGGLVASCAWIIMRKMGGKVHFTIAPFYFSLGCTFTGTILYLLNVQKTTIDVTYSWFGILMIATIAVLTFIGQLMQSLAYEYEKASRVAIFYYLQTALVYGYDYIFFSTVFGTFEIFGTVLIVGCNFTVALFKFCGYID